MQDYRTVNLVVIINAGVEEDAGLSYCELL